MIHLALRTEYSFGKVFGKIEDIVELGKKTGVVGIADINNTYGFAKFDKLCRAANVKPIFGVRLTVIDDLAEKRRPAGPECIFIAKNNDGLKEIYNLVTHAYENFYYAPRVSGRHAKNLSENVFVIAPFMTAMITGRVDYIIKNKYTPIKNPETLIVAISDNYFMNAEDRPIYEIICDGGDSKTGFQHILSNEEYLLENPGCELAINNTSHISNLCNVTLTKAPMVKFEGKITLETLCKRGAMRLGIDIKNDGEYKERYEYEMSLIKEKEYTDYFLIVADMISKAKQKMLVGPGRGSSGGSLVCYLCGITTFDPIKFGLLFERFIDINRHDLPDIDIDFPDDKRQMVLKDLVKTYGEEKVAHIGTISKLKPKSAIGIFAKQLNLPYGEVEELKNSIIERSGGDARAAMCIEDTLNSTEVGRNFMEQYPEIKLVSKIESHASHVGVHAAGMLVSNEDLRKYCSVNKRDTAAMIDKKDADDINLLKIDCLGLRTLTVLAETAKLSGFDFEDYYSLPLDDDNVFQIFRDMRLSGIFQFEGYALQSVCRQMVMDCFDDVVAVTSLSRPGPLHSGGTTAYISRRTGAEKIEYISDDPIFKKITEETYGVVVFQEQLMKIAREYAGMEWTSVSALRKAASKSLGDDFFNKYKNEFLEGTDKRGIDRMEAVNVWEHIVTFGSWGFNKSHAIAYSLISYWTAWAKYYYPTEFCVANLNNAKGDSSAVKMLRDMVKNEDMKYIAVDPDLSGVKWTPNNGVILGGLTNIEGIGIKKAQSIIKKRNEGKGFTPSLVSKLVESKTIFDVLFPCEEYFGDFYRHHKKLGFEQKLDYIENIQDKGNYIFIGRLVKKNLRDVNEYQSVVKRGGEIIHDNTLHLNITIEDDTDSIICLVDRFSYDRLGKDIAENGIVDEDYYLIAGMVKSSWRIISITEVFKLDINQKYLES